LVNNRIRQIVEKRLKLRGTATVELPFLFITRYFNNVALTEQCYLTTGLQLVHKMLSLYLRKQARRFFLFRTKSSGLFFYIGGLPKGKDPKTSGGHHTPDFFLDESGFITGVNALCNLVFDYPEIKNN
jgi:amidohydrolase